MTAVGVLARSGGVGIIGPLTPSFRCIDAVAAGISIGGPQVDGALAWLRDYMVISPHYPPVCQAVY
jgi:hypothetical protein